MPELYTAECDCGWVYGPSAHHDVLVHADSHDEQWCLGEKVYVEPLGPYKKRIKTPHTRRNEWSW